MSRTERRNGTTETTMNTPITLIVGPDSESRGTAWGARTPDDTIGSGGSPGRAKGARTRRTDDWIPAVRRAMRDLGIKRSLSDAEIAPSGWSQGAGHAPDGVRVVWL
jgi:hypothetical protein